MSNSKRTVDLTEQGTLDRSLGGGPFRFWNHAASRMLQQTRILALFSVLIIWAFMGGGSCGAQTLAEALDTTNLVWTTGGDAPWFAQTNQTHDGVDAVQSGVVGTNQTSWIETTVIGPATFSYWLNTTNSGGFVNWYFTLNGSGSGARVPWLTFWNGYILDLAEGTNVLRWTRFNYYGDQGSVFLDQVAVAPPRTLTITYQPDDLTVFAGAWASVQTVAVGTPPLQYQWRKDGNEIPGATNDWIYFVSTTTNDAGVYSVTVSNAQGFVVSSNAFLTVQPPTPPFMTYQPQGGTAYTGQSFYFSQGVNGSPPFSYQWRKNGTNLPGATSYNLNLTNVFLTDAGNYTVVVSNGVGSVESTQAVLTVVASVAPVFTRQPHSLEVVEGTKTWLTSAATGDPTPGYFWTKVGTVPPTNAPGPGPFPPQLIPFEQATRLFTNVVATNAGIYHVRASNYGGDTVSQDALLTVLPPMQQLGSWFQGAADVFVTNGLAYLAQGNSGLGILSVSNPAAPMLLGGYNTPGSASAVCVVGGTAYVADYNGGLQIISVTNPFNPVRLGGYVTSGFARDVVVRSNLAFVAEGVSGLQILNVSNPAAPFLVGSYLTNSAADRICLSGNLAYVGSLGAAIGTGSWWTNGLVVLDVFNPAQPVIVGRIPDEVAGMVVRGNFLFAAVGQGVKVIDVSNLAIPQVVHWPSWEFLPVTFFAHDIQVIQNLAYVAGSDGVVAGLRVFDIRAPDDPIPVGTFSTAGSADSVWVEGNLVYMTGAAGSLNVIQTPFDTRPVMPAQLSLSKQAGLSLHLQGRRGLHYSVEATDNLSVPNWQPLQTILATNESSVISVPAVPAGGRFFRARQVD
ncbi:MAG: repeat protein [Pedosphaera sp.]|nr:repeat protein [Pedosphaera sp.]